jgi:pyruvate carboxylase
VVQAFIAQAADSGVDVFRVFDSLNWVENMRVAMDAVVESGKICEGTICYTGDLFDKNRDKYNLDYYLTMARDLTAAGAQFIGLKDMAGLLKPAQARVLIDGIKAETSLPIHFHTHDTSGAAAATVLAACDAGVDIVDAAFDAMSGGTSQPCLGSIVEALRFTDRDTQIKADDIAVINRYWEQVRAQYRDFESGLEAPASEVYKHEMPGGQFTNLKAQAKSMGLAPRWAEVARAYQDANQIFGDIVKVTPSSKVVGDMALMMVTQNLSKEDVTNPDCKISFPESVVDMLRGNLGQPPGGFPSDITSKALGDIKPIDCRPGELLGAEDIDARRQELLEFAGDEPIDNEDLNGYLMYPKVFKDYLAHHAKYGPVRTLPTRAFFYGMNPGEAISVEIDKGKVLEITCLTISEANKKGVAKVFFELNGQPRVVSVRDQSASSDVSLAVTADPKNENHVGAPMPGMVASVEVKAGQTVSKDDVVMVIEAMKMEMSIRAERDGTIDKLHVAQGDQIDVGDLMYEFA